MVGMNHPHIRVAMRKSTSREAGIGGVEVPVSPPSIKKRGGSEENRTGLGSGKKDISVRKMVRPVGTS